MVGEGDQERVDPAPGVPPEGGETAPGWLEVTQAVMVAAGRGAVRGGQVVGQGLAWLYNAVDPDVRRHLAQLPLMSYSLLAGRPGEVRAGEDDGAHPLIFVHGLGGNSGEFLPMALYLKLAGRSRSYRARFEPGQSLDEMAATLADFIESVRRVNGTEQVEVVAHSLGGLVARLAILDHDLAGAVRTLITLGTPHGGTHAARFAGTGITRQLRPDSPLIQRLASDGWPEGVAGVTMWSRGDVMVLPAEAALVEGTRTVDASPSTHYGYLLHPDSWRRVWESLTS